MPSRSLEVLSCPMGPNRLEAETVGEYLIGSLAELWKYGRDGDLMDWHEPIYSSLHKARVVQENPIECSFAEEADRAVRDAIDLIASWVSEASEAARS